MDMANGTACSVEGCGRVAKTRGWCSTHYNRWLEHGDVRADVPVAPRRTPSSCSVEGCGRPRTSRGWCYTHYSRWRKHGDVQANIPVGPCTPREGSCACDGCDRPISRVGLCAWHARRGDAEPILRTAPCIVPVCDRRSRHATGLCEGHRRHAQRGIAVEDMTAIVSRPRGNGRTIGWLTSGGYRVFRRPEHPNAPPGGMIGAHVVVMAEHLGHPLPPGATVHHRNGIRDDNRIENLELRLGAHGRGQAVPDLIRWLVETHRAELEAELERTQPRVDGWTVMSEPHDPATMPF